MFTFNALVGRELADVAVATFPREYFTYFISKPVKFDNGIERDVPTTRISTIDAKAGVYLSQFADALKQAGIPHTLITDECVMKTGDIKPRWIVDLTPCKYSNHEPVAKLYSCYIANNGDQFTLHMFQQKDDETE